MLTLKVFYLIVFHFDVHLQIPFPSSFVVALSTRKAFHLIMNTHLVPFKSVVASNSIRVALCHIMQSLQLFEDNFELLPRHLGRTDDSIAEAICFITTILSLPAESRKCSVRTLRLYKTRKKKSAEVGVRNNSKKRNEYATIEN